MPFVTYHDQIFHVIVVVVRLGFGAADTERRPSECDDVIRRAVVSMCRRKQAAAPSVFSSRFSVTTGDFNRPVVFVNNAHRVQRTLPTVLHRPKEPLGSKLHGVNLIMMASSAERTSAAAESSRLLYRRRGGVGGPDGGRVALVPENGRSNPSPPSAPPFSLSLSLSRTFSI